MPAGLQVTATAPEPGAVITCSCTMILERKRVAPDDALGKSARGVAGIYAHPLHLSAKIMVKTDRF